MSDLSWLNPTPHAIAVYASQPLSPVATQHSLPSGRYSLTWAGLPPAGSHQLAAGALIRSRDRGTASATWKSSAPAMCSTMLSPSGHVNRIKRPNTWLHRPACGREESPCQLGAVHTWHSVTFR